MSCPRLNICKYTPVRICDEFGVNARFNLLFKEVCALKNGSQYILPIASSTILGGIRVGTGLTINSSTGVLSTTNPDPGNLHISITQNDFESDGVTYLNPLIEDDNVSIFVSQLPNFLYKEDGAWEYVSGGFRMLVPWFDANSNNYNLELFFKNP